MARSSSQMIDNFARKSTQYKVAVFALIGALLGLAYWQLMLSPMQEDLESQKANHARLLKEQEKYDADLKELKRLVTENDQLQTIIQTNQKALPTEAELPSLFDHLQRKAGEAGVTFKQWEKKTEVTVDSFIKVSVPFQATGTFYQLVKYFSLLAPVKEPPSAMPVLLPTPPAPGAAPAPAPTPPPAPSPAPSPNDIEERIVSIENLVLETPELKNDELFLVAKFVAATYRQADETLSTPGAKPAPTPGGKVGNATKAAEDKVKNATGDTTPDAKPAAPTKVNGADRLKGVE
jgi:Tfp pilus assembly protein PilO